MVQDDGWTAVPRRQLRRTSSIVDRDGPGTEPADPAMPGEPRRPALSSTPCARRPTTDVSRTRCTTSRSSGRQGDGRAVAVDFRGASPGAVSEHEGSSIGQADLQELQGDPARRASCGFCARIRATSSGRARAKERSMARIAGVDLPRNKRMEIALTYIYGIGRSARRARSAPRPRSTRARKTRRPDRRRGRRASVARSTRTTRSRATCAARSRCNIKRLIDLGCYRGLRHRRNLPVRGQRTHTNARTRKGPRQHGRRQEAGAVEGLTGSARTAIERQKEAPRQSSRSPAAPRRAPEHRPPKKAKRLVSEGVRPHPFDVQQHDRHDHRPAGQRARRGRAPGRSGSRARARARRSPRRSRRRRRRARLRRCGMRTCRCT